MIDINICQIDGACGIALELSYTSNYRSHVHSQRTTNIKSNNCTTYYVSYISSLNFDWPDSQPLGHN